MSRIIWHCRQRSTGVHRAHYSGIKEDGRKVRKGESREKDKYKNLNETHRRKTKKEQRRRRRKKSEREREGGSWCLSSHQTGLISFRSIKNMASSVLPPPLNNPSSLYLPCSAHFPLFLPVPAAQTLSPLVLCALPHPPFLSSPLPWSTRSGRTIFCA